MSAFKETPYKTADELGITETERERLINTIPFLLAAEPHEFNVMNWDRCIAGFAGLGKSEHQMSGPLYWNLCCRQGNCWAEGVLGNHRSGPSAAGAIVRFLSGSELGKSGKPVVIKNRLMHRHFEAAR